MKFGVREICDVVLKAKSKTVIGNKTFYANEPVIYFDTLKTSSMEGATTTVYAQGGRGNSRLVAWEGERTVTFTMEDALISPEGFMILSGAGLVEASDSTPVYQHITETIDVSAIQLTSVVVNKASSGVTGIKIPVSANPYLPSDTLKSDGNNRIGNYAYVMFIKDGEIISEPFIPIHTGKEAITNGENATFEGFNLFVTPSHDCYDEQGNQDGHYRANYNSILTNDGSSFDLTKFDSVLVDYYTQHKNGGAQQIEITADKFNGCNYYLEASTLFRDQHGVDMPAEFIIPNCRIQSNFTFTMASSGDPSTFTFTIDAFPDYTRFDRSKKVLAAIQVIRNNDDTFYHRLSTPADK